MLLKEGQIRIPSGCAISSIFSRKGSLIDGSQIIQSISVMHDRSNGLGGGFAAYGIYPKYRDFYAFHTFYYSKQAKEKAEALIRENFKIEQEEIIPTRETKAIKKAPEILRYFVKPDETKLEKSGLDEREFVARFVININNGINGANIFSSGKNMGAFKAVGYPEDVGAFYALENYSGYLWTAHGRYPTNTPGWWGGAHPFGLLDYTIVHNGEISSYDANRRFIEMYGYKCGLLTDTEVITYIFDFLNRVNKIPLEEIPKIICAKFWDEIDGMPEEEKKKYEFYRRMFGSLLICGPFSIVLGFEGGMMALNDRLKLRGMIAAEKGDMLYIASEECAIRSICPEPERVWAPKGGEPVIARLWKGDRK